MFKRAVQTGHCRKWKSLKVESYTYQSLLKSPKMELSLRKFLIRSELLHDPFLKLKLPFPLNLSCRDVFLTILFLFILGKTFKFRIRRRKTRDHESGIYNQSMSVIIHKHVFCIFISLSFLVCVSLHCTRKIYIKRG